MTQIKIRKTERKRIRERERDRGELESLHTLALDAKGACLTDIRAHFDMFALLLFSVVVCENVRLCRLLHKCVKAVRKLSKILPRPKKARSLDKAFSLYIMQVSPNFFLANSAVLVR